MDKAITISRSASICAARHFAAAHESACTGRPVDFGGVCTGCSEWEACRGDWQTAAEPIFNAAAVWPKVFREPCV